MRSNAVHEPPAPVRIISSSRPAFSMAATTPSAMSSSWVYTASMSSLAWRIASITSSPRSGVKSAGCWATISMPSPHSASMVSAKPCAAVGRHRDAGDALDLHDVALAVELIGDERGGLGADVVVVAEDRGPGGLRRGEEPVDVDDRDAGLHRLLGDRRELVTVVGQHDEHVGLLVDDGLDLRGLAVGVGRLEQAELDVVDGIGGLLRLGRDLAEPAVIGRRHAGDDRHGLARVVARAAVRRASGGRPRGVGGPARRSSPSASSSSQHAPRRGRAAATTTRVVGSSTCRIFLSAGVASPGSFTRTGACCGGRRRARCGSIRCALVAG